MVLTEELEQRRITFLKNIVEQINNEIDNSLKKQKSERKTISKIQFISGYYIYFIDNKNNIFENAMFTHSKDEYLKECLNILRNNDLDDEIQLITTNKDYFIPYDLLYNIISYLLEKEYHIGIKNGVLMMFRKKN